MRPRRTLLTVTLAAALLGLGGCSFFYDFDDYYVDAALPDMGMPDLGAPDSGEGDAEAVDAGLSIAAFYERTLVAQCERGQRCEAKLRDFSPIYQLGCHATIRRYIVARLVASTRENVAVDMDAAAACLDALTSTDCAITPNLLACERALRGTLPPGAPCSADEACSGGKCVWSGPTCEGTCVALNPVGARCERNDDCMATLRCIDGICRPIAVAGARCDDFGDCGPELICAGDSLLTLSCVPLPGEGDECARLLGYDPCAGDLVCSGPTDGRRTCVVGRGEGDDCSEEWPCQPGFRCSPSHRCVRVAFGGDPCDAASNCPLLHACSGSPRRCTPFPGLGERCSGTLLCLQGVCGSTANCELLPEGQPCTGGNGFLGGQCAGRCIESSPDDGACHPRLGSGEGPCEEDAECAPGLVCRGLDGDRNCISCT
jgi:hypothetical protein